jgi:hydroxymethylpyrimidine/phosphomethylpyrimidine kinase
VDVLFDGRRFHAFTVPRVNGPNVGGTGCSYSSALAAFLARGDELAVAAEKAQLHVAKLIASYTER